MGLIGLDPSKSVGGAFELEGYPTLVILDQKGVVQSVHVGYDPTASVPLNKSLAKEIDTLLSGKSLVTTDAKQEASKRSREMNETIQRLVSMFSSSRTVIRRECSSSS